MEPFTVLEGVAAPLPRQNIDTDVVIRIERLLSLPDDALGPYAFESLRYRPDGEENPDFVLNQGVYRDASILIAGRNFGCGSSREGAVHAIQGFGIRCVIAASFGDIFHSNCFQNGVLPVVLPEQQVQALMAQAGPNGAPFRVDLERQVIVAPDGGETRFEINPVRRQGLLAGLDEISLTQTREAEIADFQARDRVQRPWVYFEDEEPTA